MREIETNSNNNIFYYVLISHGFAWVFWIIAAVISHILNSSVPMVLHLIGGLSPVLLSILIYYIYYNKREKKGFARRLINIHWNSITIFLIISPLLMMMLSQLIYSVVSEGNITFIISKEFMGKGLLYAVFLLFFGPIPEEIGWRGIFLDKLINENSIHRSFVIISIVWLTWHFPLFFIKSSYQYELGFMSREFFIWAIQLLSQSIIIGIIYIISKRSIPAAIMYHYLVNLVGEMFEDNLRISLILTAIYLISSVCLYLWFVRSKEFENKIVSD